MNNNLSDVQRLKNTGQYNRKHLIRKTIIADVDGSKYLMSISGIGQSTVKLSLFLTYQDILNNKDIGLTGKLYKMINKVY